MLIVGTAGHIDHGKTTLIYALTGMDTDRLAEEKRRGISIDLGFAHLTSSDGTQISFVDVPGHERFLKNMLAGVGAIGAVLLVVAADDGVKPQTREHFEICRLLQIPFGVIALTKTDAATPNQTAATRSSITALVKGSFLERAAIVPVSARTLDGLDALRSELVQLVSSQPTRAANRLVRMNIDRSFSAKGFGTVVTGALLEGQLRTGETVQIHPAGKTAKVRGLQVHGKSRDLARAGERTAVNLSGIDHDEIQRGFVLTHCNELAPTSLIDTSVEWLAQEHAPAKREQFLLHAGTAEIPVYLKAVGPGHARIWLSSPTLMLPGDRFILRRPSPAETVGGGIILDTFPPDRLSRSKTNSRLSKLEGDSWSQRLELMVNESVNGLSLPQITKRTGLPADVLRGYISGSNRLVLVEPAQRVLSVAWLEANRHKMLAWLRDFHRQNPNAAGAPIAEARLHLEPAIAAAVFASTSEVRITGDIVALTTHKAQTSPEQTKLLVAIEQAFRQAGLQPAVPDIVLQQAGTNLTKGRAFLEALIKAQRLIRVSDEIIFHVDAITQIRRSLAAQKGRKFSIPEFKGWTKISRKYAVPLLEYLDRQHVTRREGDARLIL